jgi:hypothetical protein
MLKQTIKNLKKHLKFTVKEKSGGKEGNCQRSHEKNEENDDSLKSSEEKEDPKRQRNIRPCR